MSSRLRLAVIGKPVLHSRSPQIHHAAMKALAIEGVYLRLAVESGAEALTVARDMGLCGFNVTAPFKEQIFELVTELTPEAKAVRAVNTVLLTERGVSGHNTDVAGILVPLKKTLGTITGKRVIILGAGGAARAAAYALTREGCSVTIANRTFEKAQKLAALFPIGALPTAATPLSGAVFETSLRKADIVVNTLAATDVSVNSECFTSSQVILESVYSKTSAIAEFGRAKNATIISALEWLIAQGAAAFRIFCGAEHMIDDEVVSSVMRSALAAGDTGGKSHPKALALIGMMGSGKSIVAEKLAHQSERSGIELDERIVAAAGCSIAEVFQKQGEESFRKLETQALKAAVNGEPSVISCGGGIVLKPENRKVLRESCQVAWLWANPRELVMRIGKDLSRPLLAEGEPQKKLTDLLLRRWELYAETCDFVLPTEGRSAEEVAARILYETSV